MRLGAAHRAIMVCDDQKIEDLSEQRDGLALRDRAEQQHRRKSHAHALPIDRAAGVERSRQRRGAAARSEASARRSGPAPFPAGHRGCAGRPSRRPNEVRQSRVEHHPAGRPASPTASRRSTIPRGFGRQHRLRMKVHRRRQRHLEPGDLVLEDHQRPLERRLEAADVSQRRRPDQHRRGPRGVVVPLEDLGDPRAGREDALRQRHRLDRFRTVGIPVHRGRRPPWPLPDAPPGSATCVSSLSGNQMSSASSSATNSPLAPARCPGCARRSSRLLTCPSCSR